MPLTNEKIEAINNPMGTTEEIAFKEKLVKEGGYQSLLTLTCLSCNLRFVTIYKGEDIPCPNKDCPTHSK